MICVRCRNDCGGEPSWIDGAGPHCPPCTEEIAGPL